MPAEYALAVALAVSALAVVPIADGRRTAPPPNGFAIAYACESCSPSHKWTQAQANEQAAQFRLITAASYAYAGLVAGMKRTNPAVQIYGYEDLTTTTSDDLPEDCYLHSTLSGNPSNRVQIRTDGHFAADPTSPCWISRERQLAYTILDASDNTRKDHSVGSAGPTYDGIFTDNAGWPLLDSATSLPLDPRTGQPYAPQRYETDLLFLADAIAQSTGKPVIGNALWAGPRYFSDPPTSQAFGHMGTAMAEGFSRWSNTPLDRFRSVAAWKQDVDMLVDAGRKGKSVIALVQVDSALNPTQAQLDQWHKYALASFLLGTNGNSYFQFRLTRSDKLTPSAWSRAAIGMPQGAYFRGARGVWERDFSRGRVFVNPTTAAVTVGLGGRYSSPNGMRFRSITLKPHTGEILIRS